MSRFPRSQIKFFSAALALISLAWVVFHTIGDIEYLFAKHTPFIAGCLCFALIWLLARIHGKDISHDIANISRFVAYCLSIIILLLEQFASLLECLFPLSQAVEEDRDQSSTRIQSIYVRFLATPEPLKRLYNRIKEVSKEVSLAQSIAWSAVLLLSVGLFLELAWLVRVGTHIQ